MTRELKYSVEDMSCNHCGGAISREVAEVDGVEQVDVDLEHKQVTVHGRELIEQVIADAILVAGYSPRLLVG